MLCEKIDDLVKKTLSLKFSLPELDFCVLHA